MLVALPLRQLPAYTQQAAGPSAMGTVATREARVTGGLEVQGDRARLLTNASVTAYERTAAISLDRGGEVLVCSTSEFHLLHSGAGPSLLFGLDRGALELHAASTPQDVLLTPDIRFTVEHPGAFDLRLRVTRDGDTCVDNAGAGAPVLLLADPFSAATYRLLPGQHVLFEHGSLREVVDRERSSCGCPAVVTTPSQVAASDPGVPTSATAATAQHPFPEAASNDLAPTAAAANPVSASNSPPGEKSTQIASTFNYGEGQGPPPSTLPPPVVTPAKANSTASGGTPAATPGREANQAATPPPAPPGAHDLAHALGRFFHRLFHPGS